MLITVTGRQTGKKYTTPVGFYQKDDSLWIISNRDRTWWRNLQVRTDVEMRIHGKDMKGFGEVVLDEDSVIKQLGDYLEHIPLAAKSLGVRIESGKPNSEDMVRLAKERLFVKIKLNL